MEYIDTSCMHRKMIKCQKATPIIDDPVILIVNNHSLKIDVNSSYTLMQNSHMILHYS